MSLKALVAKALGVPESRVKDDAAKGRLRGWDSMGHVAVVTAIESHFAVAFEEAEILRMTSLDEIRSVLAQKGVSVAG